MSSQKSSAAAASSSSSLRGEDPAGLNLNLNKCHSGSEASPKLIPLARKDERLVGLYESEGNSESRRYSGKKRGSKIPETLLKEDDKEKSKAYRSYGPGRSASTLSQDREEYEKELEEKASRKQKKKDSKRKRKSAATTNQTATTTTQHSDDLRLAAPVTTGVLSSGPGSRSDLIRSASTATATRQYVDPRLNTSFTATTNMIPQALGDADVEAESHTGKRNMSFRRLQVPPQSSDSPIAKRGRQHIGDESGGKKGLAELPDVDIEMADATSAEEASTVHRSRGRRGGAAVAPVFGTSAGNQAGNSIAAGRARGRRRGRGAAPAAPAAPGTRAISARRLQWPERAFLDGNNDANETAKEFDERPATNYTPILMRDQVRGIDQSFLTLEQVDEIIAAMLSKSENHHHVQVIRTTGDKNDCRNVINAFDRDSYEKFLIYEYHMESGNKHARGKVVWYLIDGNELSLYNAEPNQTYPMFKQLNKELGPFLLSRNTRRESEKLVKYVGHQNSEYRENDMILFLRCLEELVHGGKFVKKDKKFQLNIDEERRRISNIYDLLKTGNLVSWIRTAQNDELKDEDAIPSSPPAMASSASAAPTAPAPSTLTQPPPSTQSSPPLCPRKSSSNDLPEANVPAGTPRNTPPRFSGTNGTPRPISNSFGDSRTPRPISNSFGDSRTPRPISNSFGVPRTPRPISNSFGVPRTPRPISNSFGDSRTPRPISNLFGVPRTPRPISNLFGDFRTPRPVADSFGDSRTSGSSATHQSNYKRSSTGAPSNISRRDSNMDIGFDDLTSPPSPHPPRSSIPSAPAPQYDPSERMNQSINDEDALCTTFDSSMIIDEQEPTDRCDERRESTGLNGGHQILEGQAAKSSSSSSSSSLDIEDEENMNIQFFQQLYASLKDLRLDQLKVLIDVKLIAWYGNLHILIGKSKMNETDFIACIQLIYQIGKSSIHLFTQMEQNEKLQLASRSSINRTYTTRDSNHGASASEKSGEERNVPPIEHSPAQSIQTSRSSINRTYTTSSRDPQSTAPTTENAIFKKQNDDSNVKRSQDLLNKSYEFTEYLQKKHNLDTTQTTDILGPQISRKKQREDDSKNPDRFVEPVEDPYQQQERRRRPSTPTSVYLKGMEPNRFLSPEKRNRDFSFKLPKRAGPFGTPRKTIVIDAEDGIHEFLYRTPPSQTIYSPEKRIKVADDVQRELFGEKNNAENEKRQLLKNKPYLPHDFEMLLENVNFQTKERKQGDETFGEMSIKGYDLYSLGARQYVNDVIIDKYMELVCSRSTDSGSNYRKSFAFGTFFYTKLNTGQDPNELLSWIKEDLFSYEILYLPICQGNHWYLFVADTVNRNHFVYDSYYDVKREKEINQIVGFLKFYAKKKNRDIDWDNWSKNPVEEQIGPKQTNDVDCGVFLCQYAEHLSRRANLDFTQSGMANYRKIMLYELIKGHLTPKEEEKAIEQEDA